jgi:hypothetical protein
LDLITLLRKDMTDHPGLLVPYNLASTYEKATAAAST